MEFIERLETKIVPTARIWAAKIDDGIRTLRPHLEHWNGKVRIWTEKVVTQVLPEIARRIRAAHRKAVKASAKAREGPPAIVERKVVPFDPATPLLWLSAHDPFRLVDAFEGAHVFGSNGSGKTSGPGAAIIKSFMRAGMGGLVLTAKPDEYDLIARHAAETGRSSSLIRFAPEEKWRFNFLAYESKRPSRGAGLTANIVKLFTVVQESLDRGDDAGGKQERYWKNALNQLLANAIDLCLIATPDEKLSIARLHEVILSAPANAEQVDSESWQLSSLTYQLLEKALQNDNLSAGQKRDLRLTGKFWLTEFPQLPNDTRGSIISTFTTMADGFVRGTVGELFSTGLNLVPEMTLEGAIVVVDLPIKSFGHVGLAAQILMKMIFQQCWERRDVHKNPRPVMLIADESHNFVNEYDVHFQTTARSSRACTLYLSQTLPNYEWALGEAKGKALTESLMGVLGTKIFCANNDPRTCKWASEIFGKSWQQRSNHGVSHGDQGNRTVNTGGSESLEYVIEPSVFTKLRKGGPANNFEVDALIFGGGRTFKATGAQYLPTVFNQRG